MINPLPEKDYDQYSMVLSSASLAESLDDALGMFLCQMASGNVVVEVKNEDTGDVLEHDDLADHNAYDQINLAIGILKRLGDQMTPEQRASLSKLASDLPEPQAPTA